LVSSEDRRDGIRIVDGTPDVDISPSSSERAEPIALVIGEPSALRLELRDDGPVSSKGEDVGPSRAVTLDGCAPAMSRPSRTDMDGSPAEDSTEVENALEQVVLTHR
jgi:hypothetical protein